MNNDETFGYLMLIKPQMIFVGMNNISKIWLDLILELIVSKP